MRLIDADEIIKCFDPNTWQGDMMISIANGLATINPINHGKWIQICTSDNEYVGVECSVCNETQYGFDNFRNYCSNCGAKMDKK